MRVIGIDNVKCIKCIECVDVCPLDLFYKPPTKVGDHRRIIFEDPNGICNRCEWCTEICPTNAILVK
ncbi:MAG: 4Fe-4S binding protein [Candidatus Hodarchaeota archaeon]